MEKLAPDRHPNLDFFSANILEASFKDDLGSMEHPMFALRAGDKAIREYQHCGQSIEITPSVKGLATIHDKDVLIYCTSQIIQAINKGFQTSRTVRVIAHDLLVNTNRGTGGDHYERLQVALDRLNGTVIKTNILTGNKRIREGFGLIDNYKIIEVSPINHRMVSVEIRLSEWLYNAIIQKEVLTISRDYFRLRKPLERRLYEIARKHCGNQSKWTIKLKPLHKKTGSKSTFFEFRRLLREIVEHRHLPDYIVQLTELDLIKFFNKDAYK